MRHIDASGLFAFAEGQGDLQEHQREHLKKCGDCQKVLAVFETYLADSKDGENRGLKGKAADLRSLITSPLPWLIAIAAFLLGFYWQFRGR